MMRRRDVSGPPTFPGHRRHLGWGYHDRGQFLRAAAQFLRQGLARNELVEFVGEGTPSELTAAMRAAGLPDVRVTPAQDFYPVSDDRVLDPDAAIATLTDAAGRALAEGYAGLRIVGDATCLVRRPEGRDAFARYEFLADRVIAELPIAAMCAFGITALGDAAAELVCLHGEVGEAVPDFRIHAAPGVAFALGGEIDAASADLFASTLDRVWPLLDRDDVVIDASRLDYLDHSTLLRLDATAAQSGRRILLRGAGPLVCRLVGVLRPSNTVVEPAA